MALVTASLTAVFTSLISSRVGSSWAAKQAAAVAAERKSQIGSGDRSERVRTYNFPQNRVTDHRLTGDNKNFNIAAIMNGNLDPLIDALVTAEQAEVHGFEDKHVFEGCMPVEVMARRGRDTLRYGPLKPRGLRDPKTGKEPFAVVQLRKDNAEGSIYNLVGFQTHLRFPEQKRVFSMIPALHDADFVRYGVMHRNTYLRSPGLLDRYYRLIADGRIAFAGQMTGVEGYVESAASGFLAGVEMARRLLGERSVDFPMETAVGALGRYVSNPTVVDFQPMNINFGIMPPLGCRIRGGKRVKNAALSERSLALIDALREEVLQDIKE